MRINRFIARCGVASRRKADELIRAGRISVNGVVVRSFIDVSLDDEVCIDGESISLPVRLYYAFNKPPRVLSVFRDRNRRTVGDYFGSRDGLFCVGRLDFMSEGLLLVTNDGEFANAVIHPSMGVRKVYLVKTPFPVPEDKLSVLRRGVPLEDGLFKPLDAGLTSNPLWMRIIIADGRNRVIRRTFRKLGVPIARLKRVAIGDIWLGDLPIGRFRELSRREISTFLR